MFMSTGAAAPCNEEVVVVVEVVVEEVVEVVEVGGKVCMEW